jgi:hypothetical protein
MPDRHGEVSVFRTDGLTRAETDELGRSIRPERTFRGWAAHLARHVKAHSKLVRLILEEKPERHASIVGWPQEKDKQKSIAADLAAKSRYEAPLKQP